MFQLTLKKPVINTKNWWLKAQKDYLDKWRDDIKEYWESEKDPVTERSWDRRIGDYPWKILRKSGDMQDSAKLTVGGNNIFTAEALSYGAYHQRGTKRLAQRRWIGIPKEGIEKLMELSIKHIFSDGRTKITKWG